MIFLNKKVKIILLIFLGFFLIQISISHAAKYQLGTVEEVISEEKSQNEFSNDADLNQIVRVKFKDQIDVINHKGVNSSTKVQKGERVVLHQLEQGDYYIIDKYRLPVFIFIFIFLLIGVYFFTKTRGLLSLLGLLISFIVLVIMGMQILKGRPPLLVSTIGALIIAFFSLYLAHGVNIRITLALISTVASILFSVFLSYLFVKLSQLTGGGSDDAFYLQIGTKINIDLQGVLMSGIIIGTLGILDDITTTQTAAVYELKKANAKMNCKKLFCAGLNIGKEHILSMMNTLVLAYAGASFPLFLLFGLEDNQSLWVNLNSELVAEEIIRALVGSFTLLCAVPLSCFLAAYYYGKKGEIN